MTYEIEFLIRFNCVFQKYCKICHIEFNFKSSCTLRVWWKFRNYLPDTNRYHPNKQNFNDLFHIELCGAQRGQKFRVQKTK